MSSKLIPNRREEQKEARRAKLERLGPQQLLILAHRHGINLLNGPFVIETLLDEEFPELKPSELQS